MISAKTIKKTALAPTVLITHGGGFLTEQLSRTLLLKNCRVVVLTDLKIQKDSPLRSLLRNPRFAMFACDINKELPDSVESVDYIFHLANYDTFLNVEGVPNLEGLLSASVGTKNLLDLAKNSAAKFALVSPVSSRLKADHLKEISVEEAQKYSKTLVSEYVERYDLDARLIYLGHVYGPGMALTESGELGYLLNDVISGKPLRVYDDGVRKEFYLFLTDAIAGLVKSLFSSAPRATFTLIEQKPHTSLEAAYLLRSLADGKIDLDFMESAKVFGDPSVDVLSYPVSWSPKIELKDGLIKTLKSLGYTPNAKSFKAAALIDEKKREKIASPTFGALIGVTERSNSVRANPKVNSLKLLLCRLEKRFRFVASHIKLQGHNYKKLKIPAASLSVFTLLSLVFLGVPLLQSYKHATSALNSLEDYQVFVAKLDSEKSQKASEDAYLQLNKLENSLNRAGPFFKISGRAEMFESMQALVSSSKDFTSALYSFSLGAEPFSDLREGLKPGRTQDYDLSKFKTASQHFADAKRKLGFAQASLEMVDESRLPESIKIEYQNYQKALDKISENSDFLIQLAMEVPQIIGLDGQKRYLFLFQNNNEIRPTGGFLGSYAVMEVLNGKINKIDIEDVYNPDGQLQLSKANSDIKSPLPIAQALQEENLFIRNANWDPDFTKSTQTINKLFGLVDGTSFDGVFAVDLYFARDLLSVIGPLYLTAYEEEIRVDNMYERAQFYSDFDFKEGVSSKKAFMTVLGGKMLEKLFSLPQEKVPTLLNVLYTSLEQKHLLVDLSGTYVSKYLASRGWDGTLLDTKDDYLYVVNANLGGTKSNYYVKNSMNYVVSSKTGDGLLRGELELTYENTQKDASWPGGPYKDYVRVLVQDGSKLTGAFLVGGQEDSAKNGNSSDVMGAVSGTNIIDNVVINRIGKYTTFEYLITVNPSEKVKLLFNYDLPSNLSARKGSNKYSLTWQKQPGTQNDSNRFMFVAPFGTSFTERYPLGAITDSVYEYKSVLNSDLRLTLFYR